MKIEACKNGKNWPYFAIDVTKILRAVFAFLEKTRQKI